MNNSIIVNIIKRAKLRGNIDDKPTPIHKERGLECVAIYENVLEEITSNLNNYNKINWNKEQYRKLLGNWLLHFISILTHRWDRHIDKDIEFANDINVKIQCDYEEIHHYSFDVGLNIELLKILNSIRYKNKIPKLHYLTESDSINFYSLNGYNKNKLLIDQHINSSFNFMDKNEAYEYITKTTRYGNHINWEVGAKIKYKINQHWRNKFTGKKIDNFSDLCIALCHIYLPVSFLEGFNQLYKLALNYDFKYIYTSVGIINNTPLKMVAATWHGNSKLYNQQHGGGYGMHIIHWGEIFERSVAENFFTFGWKEDTKTIPLSVRPRILKHIKTSGILIKTRPNHRYSFDFFSYSINQTIKFIILTKGLNREISHYRLQPGENPENDYYVKLKYKLDNATIPDKSKNEALYSLHVLNYMGTSFLESMAADIPTICILDCNYSFYRPAFRAHIDELMEVGIIQHDGQSAAEMVMNIYHCIDSWWSGDKLQEIRHKFVKSYARFNSNWIDELSEQFERITN